MFIKGLTKQINQILALFKGKDTVISLFSATIQHGYFIKIEKLSFNLLTGVEDLMNNFLIDPIKIMIGGKNNVLKSIEQKLVYVGNEYGKRVEIHNLIQVFRKFRDKILII